MNQLPFTSCLKEIIPSQLGVQNFLVNKFSTALMLAVAAVAAAAFALIIFISRKNFLPQTTNNLFVTPVSEEEKMKNVKNFITIGMTNQQIEETMEHTVKLDQIQQWRLETEQVLNNPIIVVANGGLNQYQVGGPAACTALACSFLHSKAPCSPELIVDLLNKNTYTDVDFLETNDMLDKYDLKRSENPLPEQMGLSFMMMSFEKYGDLNFRGIAQTLPVLLDNDEIAGAIITANGLTIAMRKWGNRVEFFDSHGDTVLTNQGNAAYVISFLTSRRDQIIDFLTKRYPQIGFNPHANFQPQFISIHPIAW